MNRASRFDLDRRPLGGSSLRDHLRESSGRLTINGSALASHGQCACGCPLYIAAEVKFGACVDCSGEVRAEMKGVAA